MASVQSVELTALWPVLGTSTTNASFRVFAPCSATGNGLNMDSPPIGVAMWADRVLYVTTEVGTVAALTVGAQAI
jgi:hypothetical protein